MTMSDYNRSYRKRIVIFLGITGVYLLFTGTYTVTSFFVDISWKTDVFLYAYCTYAVWFNAYSYYRYHQNSLEEEKKFVSDQGFKVFLAEMGLPQFDHKKARRDVFWLSFLGIVLNVALMIATKWAW